MNLFASKHYSTFPKSNKTGSKLQKCCQNVTLRRLNGQIISTVGRTVDFDTRQTEVG